MMLLLGAGVLVLVVQGRARAFGLFPQPGVLLALLALNLGVLVYRLFAIIDAYRGASQRWPVGAARGQAAIGAVLLGMVLGSTLLMHGWLGLVGFKTYDLVASVFHIPQVTPMPNASLAPGQTPGPTPLQTPGPGPVPDWSRTGDSTSCWSAPMPDPGAGACVPTR